MKNASVTAGRAHWIALLTLVLGPLLGCGADVGTTTTTGAPTPTGQRQFVTLGTAPVGGAFKPVGDAFASVLNEHKGSNTWKVQAKGTKGSQQNIRMLDAGEIQLGMSNSAISYHAVRGEGSWNKKYDIRAVVTIAPNIGLFITKKDAGLNSLADLKGKRVAVGPAGAGFEMFLAPLLKAHGVTYDDFTPLNEPYTQAVQSLGDGNADAAFMGGAVPTPAVTQAATSYGVSFIPYDEETRQQLIKDFPFYQAATIPAKNKDGNATYRGMTEDFNAINVGSMHLITHASVDEETVYQITKTIWENRADIVKQHGAGRAINEKNAARFTGIEFHPGAQRFYQEIGIWPEETAASKEGDAKAGQAKEGEAKPAAKEGDESKADAVKEEKGGADEKKSE